MRYQRALESIGIVGAATIHWGSLVNGESHHLEFRSPDLQHPEVEPIGRTYREAEQRVSAAAAAIEFTARAIKRRDAGYLRPDRERIPAFPPLHDPDARSVRRSHESLAKDGE